jgi:hypothetical protein
MLILQLHRIFFNIFYGWILSQNQFKGINRLKKQTSCNSIAFDIVKKI